MWAVLWVLMPFVAFFNVARLAVSVDLAAALGLAIAVAAAVAGIAWLVSTRVLRASRPTVGSVMVSSIQGNTGYLGLPVAYAVLGSGALGNAIAYDAILSVATLLIGGAAIGAALGAHAGTGARERVRAFLVRNPPLIAVLLALVALVGFLWLGALFLVAWLQLPPPPTAHWGPIPLPTLLLVGGVVLGLLVSRISAGAAATGAWRRAERARRRVRERVEHVADDAVIGPVERELAAHTSLCRAIARLS
jgi:hypothetical protein